MSDPSVSIIVSCRNEASCIEACIRGVAKAMPGAQIVVIDGGTDDTFDIASALRAEIPSLRTFKNADDRGKGHAIREGIRRASGNVMAQFDADLQFAPEDLPRLLQPVLAGSSDVCVGSRFLPDSDRSTYRPLFFRDRGNRLLSALVSMLAGRRVTDVTSGMKAWTRAAIERIDFTDDRYSYEAEIVLKAGLRELRLVEVPVAYASRHSGDSMHKTTWALCKAGCVIAAKCVHWRWAERVNAGRGGTP